MALFPNVTNVKRLSIDTETTGLTHKDRAVGLSYAFRDENNVCASYLPWGHASDNTVLVDEVRNWWNAEIAPRDDLTVVCHNAVFDIRNLVQLGYKLPKHIRDTGVQAGLLNEFRSSYGLAELCETEVPGLEPKKDAELNEWCARNFGGAATRKEQAKNYHRAPGRSIVGPYATHDAVMTMYLDEAFSTQIVDQDLTRIHDIESQLIPVLVRMYLAGVRTDLNKAVSTRKGFHDSLSDAVRQISEIAGKQINTNSSLQLGKFFEANGIEVPRTPKGNYSVTGEFLDEIDHPIGVLVRNARKYRHYADTFIESYILENADADGFIHPSFWAVVSEFGGAITGRFTSSGGLNAQNIPKRDGFFAPSIRGLFLPAYEGGRWCKLDYSQIEYRFFAHYAGGTLRKSYVENPQIDYHQMVAELTGLPRSIAKNLNFGFLYGMGQKKLSRNLPDPSSAEEIFHEYHSRIPQVRKLSAKAEGRALRPGYVTTWGGRRSRFEKDSKGRVFGAHKALNKVIQGSAADLIKVAMIAVDKEIDWSSTIMHLTVHDELDFTVPPGEDGVKKAWQLKEIMQTCGENITVPIIAEGEVGPNWWDVDVELKETA